MTNTEPAEEVYREKPTGWTAWVSGPMLHSRRRYTVAVLSLLSIIFLFGSFFLPYWNVILKAPQYPEGLNLKIHLNKVEGDVFEVDILNHYIGIKKMEDAAKFERSMAIWGLAVISLFSLLFIFSSRRTMSIFALPALVFPFVFLIELFLWLYRFGHELDPHAPITFQPFTPQLLGEGKIGQFATVGALDIGFYLALCSFAFMLTALILRFTICNACPYKTRCSLYCSHLFFWPPPEYQERLKQEQQQSR